MSVTPRGGQEAVHTPAASALVKANSPKNIHSRKATQQPAKNDEWKGVIVVLMHKGANPPSERSTLEKLYPLKRVVQEPRQKNEKFPHEFGLWESTLLRFHSAPFQGGNGHASFRNPHKRPSFFGCRIRWMPLIDCEKYFYTSPTGCRNVPGTFP